MNSTRSSSEKFGSPAPGKGAESFLRDYSRRKLALAAHLRALCEVLADGHQVKQRDNEIQCKQCEELMAKLAEDRFALAVVGQFKRGKSSLMNAIIGRELLPVGILPLISAIAILRYGPKKRLLIRCSDVSLPLPQEEPVKRLAEFVTGKGNPGNCKRVKSATIEAPLLFLRRGLEFVDTPGIGSAIEANTVTTLKFLPECGAALFVTSGESPFTSIELADNSTVTKALEVLTMVRIPSLAPILPDLLPRTRKSLAFTFVLARLFQQCRCQLNRSP